MNINAIHGMMIFLHCEHDQRRILNVDGDFERCHKLSHTAKAKAMFFKIAQPNRGFLVNIHISLTLF